MISIFFQDVTSMDDKVLKRRLRDKAQADPEKYYPVSVFKELGLSRKKCGSCGNHFWSSSERDVCGEPECCGGYSFIGDSPAKRKMDFIDVWKRFSRMFSKKGYTPIKRYPSVARWNPTMDFTIASIAGFQPYVVSGAVKPPANPLIVPQYCLRFSDIENVGITGRHYTGFVMIGQHAFMPSRDYDQEKYFRDIHDWLTEGMKLPQEEIVFHEDAWGGGGNFGPSIEFFSRGLEIGNQVYMLYEQDHKGNFNDLSTKVLDMGMGQERPAWLSHGTETSYEANFGPVIKHMYKTTDISPDKEMLRRFLPYSGYLNIDEVEDIDKTWSYISKKTGYPVSVLKDMIIPLSGIYSICDHTRSLLIALNDGALPSNVGGGYNLRVLYRRAMDFIDRYGWDIDLHDICKRHAKYLRPQYPELSDNLDEVGQILDVERRKYYATRKKSKSIVKGLSSKDLTVSRMVELYDSKGISPEMIKMSGVDIDIPSDFYNLVTERHGKCEAKAKTKRPEKLDLEGVPATDAMYFDDYLRLDFKAKVLKVIGRDVVLDKTCFYPTGGGQMHDLGTLGGCRVEDIFRQGSVIVHRLSAKPSFKECETVEGHIDKDRRIQLAQHHTATHLINGAARHVLGNHIWQAGAQKTEKKARLDITHYETLSDDQIKRIEDLANGWIAKDFKVESMMLERTHAEMEYGFRLYQGGAVPGETLRVIRIDDLDVEACGGTHLKRTGEIGSIKIIDTKKIQDGVVRLEYVAGRMCSAKSSEFSGMVDDIISSFEGASRKDIVPRCRILFSEWKELKKMAGLAGYAQRVKDTDPKKHESLVSNARSMRDRFMSPRKDTVDACDLCDEEIISELMKIFRVQREHLVKTVRRFVKERDDYLGKIRSL